jgi:large subunit ribosomal protein L4
VNRKEVKLALRGVLSGKVKDSELVLVDEFKFDKPSTRQAKETLAKLGLADKRITLVVNDEDVNTYLSFRNLPKVVVIGQTEANAEYLIDNDALVMPVDVAKHFEEVLA